MKALNQLLTFILTLSLLLPAPALANFQEIEEEGENPYEPGVGSSCVTQNQPLLPGASCCTGLALNPNTNKCDEIVISDNSMPSCTAGEACPSGTGCYPQRASDLYSNLSPGGAEPETQSFIEAMLSESPNKPVGDVCTHANECLSYSCVSGHCEDKKICRFAAEGETPAAGVNCGTGLILSGSGVCVPDPNASNPVYLGLLNEVNVNDNGQCRFELDEETRQKSLVAMKSLRAMEFFFANISLPTEDECFQVVPELKDKVGKLFYERRKIVLANFTQTLNGIESDFQSLTTAQAGSTKTVNIHGPAVLFNTEGEQNASHGHETITEGDLATRQTSGYDSLMMMYRRNLMFQSYEREMQKIVQDVSGTVSGLSQGMSSWKDNDTSWNIGSRVVENYNCKAKYKKWKPFKWKTKYFSKTKDRWTNYYEVTGSAGANAAIVKRDRVAEYLGLMGGMTKDEAIAEFTKPKYYLMDPLMYGGQSFASHGQKKSLGSGGGLLGMLGLGTKDLRNARYLRGDSAGSYTKIYNNVKAKMDEFYKGLKGTSELPNFIYEPELVTTSAKDCATNPSNTKCEDFRAFQEEVMDQAFAQFLAYSAYRSGTYGGYFTNASTWRRRVLAKLEVDMVNINKYYEAVIAKRDQQNACIERLVNGVIDSGILGPGNGISEGNGNTSTAAATVQGLETGNNALSSRRLSPSTRAKFSFSLDGASNTNGQKTFLDGMIKSSASSDRGGVGSQSSGSALAIRNTQMKEYNVKASKAGVNLAAKENAVSSGIKSIAGTSSALGSSGSSNLLASASPSGVDFKANAGSASLMGDGDLKGGDLNGGDINGTNLGAGELGLAGGDGSGLSGISDPGASSGAASASSADDGTGLSDSEKEKMMTSYQNNKEQYQGYEDDALFKKVSKAYVRNLDRILKRKKVE